MLRKRRHLKLKLLYWVLLVSQCLGNEQIYAEILNNQTFHSIVLQNNYEYKLTFGLWDKIKRKFLKLQNYD